MNYSFKRPGLALIPVLAALAGCTTVAEVKDVMADQEGYFNQNFTAAKVSTAVAERLPKGQAGFRQLVITGEAVTEVSGGTKRSTLMKSTFADAGNGMVSERRELSQNGFAYAMAYNISYKGLLPLRWQLVPLKGKFTTMIYEVRELGAASPVPAEVGQAFSAKYKTGNSIQIAGWTESEKSCTAARRYPASQLSSKLPGTVLEFDCERRSNNAVQERTKLALIEQFGFAVEIESSSSDGKTSYFISDVTGA